ncbi:hypothetical protein ACQ4PT_031599 [Festuca glaucescens]
MSSGGDLVPSSSGADIGVDELQIDRAGWEGSCVTQAHIEWLYKSRCIPPEVECRLPGPELAPVLNPGKHVVFVAHFLRGFGLPCSPFLCNFFEKFNLQPHHLPSSAFLLLSSFVAFCEGYLGLWPTVELWSRFHSFRAQSVPDPGNKGPKPMVECGAATIMAHKRSKFIRVTGLDSCKKWLWTFLYVKNKAGLESDFIKLPTYREGPPIDRHNWDYSPGDVNPETKKICEDVQTMLNAGIPTPDDLVLTFISRRVLPLQQRSHKICQMSGHLDPTRITTRELSRASIRKKVKDISASRITDDWEWGLLPYSRRDPAPINYPRQNLKNTKIMILPDRTDMDIEDPDSESNTPAAENEDPASSRHAGKDPAIHPLKDWSDDGFADDKDDDDCTILEVYDALPLSFAYRPTPSSADPTAQVIDAVPVGQQKAPRGMKRHAAGMPTAPPKKKMTKKPSDGPKGHPPRTRAPPTSTGAPLSVSRSAAGRPATVIPSGDVIIMPPPPSSRREENVQALEAPSTSTLSPVRADMPPPEQFSLPGMGSAILVLGCTREEPVAPNFEDHHGGAQDSAPKREEDVSAGNMGADIEVTASTEQATAQPTPRPEQTQPTSGEPASSPIAPSSPKLATLTPAKSATPPAKSPLATTSSPSSSSAPTTTVPAPVKAKPQQVLGGKKKKTTVLCFVFPTLTRIFRLAVEAKNLPALKEPEFKLNAAQEEKTEMSNMLGKLKESNDEHALELQHSSCTKEIEEARKFYEDCCTKEVAETNRLASEGLAKEKEISSTLEQSNKLLTEQSDLLKKKFEAWRNLADMLNHDMEDLLRAVTDAFPESQDLAVKAVLESRKDRPANEEPYWSMEDHMVSMAARVAHMKVLGIDFPLSAIKVFKALWPGATVPKSVQGLCKWLNATEMRLSQWRESVGRAGADMALQFILSWYEEIDFNSISTLRVGSHILEDPAIKLKCQAKAYELASYAPVHNFIPDPEDDKEDEAKEGAEGAEEGSEGSTEDSDEEVDEELEAEAPPSKKTKTIEPTSEEPASSSNVGSADIPSADAPSTEVPASSEKE